MEALTQAFAASYAEARVRFLDAAAAAGLHTTAHLHPLTGHDGEPLALDVARDGPPHATRLLILSSGCHGIEGYGGSGVQVAALRDAGWRAQARDLDVAVLYLHALDPHGFSHGRRVTHEGVDLNRNFIDFASAPPANPGYAELHPWLLPERWPPDRRNRLHTLALLATHGARALQATITRGQHAWADGLFYGGTAPCWSHRTLRQVLREHGAGALRIGWIDLHTGLGPCGVGERIFAGPPEDRAALARARRWWGEPLTASWDGSSNSAALTGELWNALPQECPQAEGTAITLEFGTVPARQVLQALRADHWLHQHPQAPPALAQQIRRQMREAFSIDTPEWKAQLIRQGLQALRQAARGLAA